jgi:hypothetical protein
MLQVFSLWNIVPPGKLDEQIQYHLNKMGLAGVFVVHAHDKNTKTTHD